jgi:hypothetical protein
VRESKYVIIKSKVHNRYEYSVPACEYINRNVGQVLISENEFCHIDEKFSKNHPYADIFCSYVAVCFIINMMFIRCLHNTDGTDYNEYIFEICALDYISELICLEHV